MTEEHKDRRTSTTITMPSWAVMLFIALFLGAWSYIFVDMAERTHANTIGLIETNRITTVLTTEHLGFRSEAATLRTDIAAINTKLDTLLAKK